MPFVELKPKQRRTVELDLSTLFSIRGFYPNLTIEKLMQLPPFHPWVKREDGSGLPLSDKGLDALRRIEITLGTLAELRDCSSHEVAQTIYNEYTQWINRSLQPNAEEFSEGLINRLRQSVKEYHFLVSIEGVDIDDQEEVRIGSFVLLKATEAFLDTIKFGGGLKTEYVSKNFANSLWLKATCTGSPEIATARFEQKALLTAGLIGVCGSILYQGAIYRTRIDVRASPGGDKTTNSLLRWESNGENPSMAMTWNNRQPIKLDAEAVAYLNQQCLLNKIAQIIDATQRTELQDAIVRALYWFADAHRDRNPTMQFVKLWSCAESFFSIENQGISEIVTRGIATALVFSNYRLISQAEYGSTKRRLKKLYDMRSKSLHRGEYEQVSESDLSEFSRWVAWVIISMTDLNDLKYTSLAKVRDQAERLDHLAKSAAGPKAN
jgi:hypothetical protein